MNRTYNKFTEYIDLAPSAHAEEKLNKCLGSCAIIASAATLTASTVCIAVGVSYIRNHMNAETSFSIHESG